MPQASIQRVSAVGAMAGAWGAAGAEGAVWEQAACANNAATATKDRVENQWWDDGDNMACLSRMTLNSQVRERHPIGGDLEKCSIAGENVCVNR